jgi:peptide deformylase
MALLTILEYPDPRLRTRATPVTQFDDALQRRIDDMFETMYAAPGIGLAAIQVGVPKRVIVMDLHRGDGPKEPRCFVNPEIVWASDELQLYEEGCLSVPEIYDEVERPAKVRVRYLNYAGHSVEEDAEGLFAVCIQHEMDHLDGVLFLDHLSRLKRDRAISRVKKAAKDEPKDAAAAVL